MSAQIDLTAIRNAITFTAQNYVQNGKGEQISRHDILMGLSDFELVPKFTLAGCPIGDPKDEELNREIEEELRIATSMPSRYETKLDPEGDSGEP